MLTEAQINEIALGVANRLSRGGAAAPPNPAPGQTKQRDGGGPVSPALLTEGIFADVDSAVDAARAGFLSFDQMTLKKREEIIASIRKDMLAKAHELAAEAHAETGFGRIEDKVVKNICVTEKTPGPEFLYPDARSGDRGLVLHELAPFGVIAAITPVTNPTSTVICNTIGMIAAGNSVVFNVHPNAKRVCAKTVTLINQAILKVGGPSNLITAVAEPTIESAQALMRHRGTNLVVVTGGPGVVAEAMKSGKRAICAGPGNPPVVVDETADLDLAARQVVYGASFDNNVICTDEKEIFAVNSIADELLRKMSRCGAFILTEVQARQIERVIFDQKHGSRRAPTINRVFIGKNAGVILREIGVHVDDSVRLVVMDVPYDHPLVATEQLMPVVPLVRVGTANEAIDKAFEAEGGCRHTASIFSRNIDNLSRMARKMNCSVFVKNGPTVCGLGAGGEGYASFTIASPTGEGMTSPRSFARLRRCTLVDHFRII